MTARAFVVVGLTAGLIAAPVGAVAQAPPAAAAPFVAPTRAIRRDIPLTDMIQRAWAAGTRDSTGRPGPHYWQLWMHYTIAASLDPASATVSGKETAVIHNNSDTAMNAIQLRLDQNLFRADVPKLEAVPQITNGMQITHMAVNGETVDLNPPPRRYRFGGPPPPVILAAYGLGETAARITLPTPIAAHDSATLEAEWSFQVAATAAGQRGERMGRWADSLFQVAQWYPRVAVFDDLRGWDTEPYLGPSEFYNNFGRFDVTIDLPAGWVVGATGVLQNPGEVLTAAERERLSRVLQSDSAVPIVSSADTGAGHATAAGERLRWHFVADTAGDFAWAASNRFQWDATRAQIPGGATVPVNIFYLPGDSTRYAAAAETVRHALQFYSKLWMPFAFPQMTIVDGPEMGMEYPMFIMSGVGAADHETGHQWWPMMVGTNETWYPFMDEGFNQYMNILSAADEKGQPPDLDGLGQAYGRISGNEEEAPLMWDANYGGPMYGFQGYVKAPMMLSMLGGIVGDTAVWRAMSEYAHTWRFKHPSPWDYAFFMDNALHRNLGWFWYYWLFTTDAVNGSIQRVVQRGRSTVVTVRQDGEMPSPVILQVQFAPKGPRIRPMRNSVMTDSATAVVTYPVDVWFSGRRTFNADLAFGARRIEKVVLDPHCRFPDRDPTDNVWPRDSTLVAASGGMFGPAQCYPHKQP